MAPRRSLRSLLRPCRRAAPVIDHSPRTRPAWVTRAEYLPKPARRSINPQLRWSSVARLQDGCAPDCSARTRRQAATLSASRKRARVRCGCRYRVKLLLAGPRCWLRAIGFIRSSEQRSNLVSPPPRCALWLASAPLGDGDVPGAVAGWHDAEAKVLAIIERQPVRLTIASAATPESLPSRD
jgi:hypothetical protein